jgi:hypothetical protein
LGCKVLLKTRRARTYAFRLMDSPGLMVNFNAPTWQACWTHLKATIRSSDQEGGNQLNKWVNSYGSGLFTYFHTLFFVCFCSFCIILSLHELYGVSIHACGYSSLYSPSPGKFVWCTVCRFGSMIPWSSLIYILNSTTIPGLRIQGWPSPQGPSPSGIFSSSPVHVSPVRVIHRSRWQPKWRQLMVLAGPSCS